MLMFLGFIVLIACLVIGVRRGGIGLATISGIGLVFFIFVMGLKPGKPPVDVMLTIMAVVTCSAFLQASKGLDVMLKYAEKFLRSNPKYITILAPLTTWLLAVLCGTGHVVYAMFPIIYDIAIKQNIRPERPMSVASIASQMGVCASPASVAVVSVVAILGATDHPSELCRFFLFPFLLPSSVLLSPAFGASTAAKILIKTVNSRKKSLILNKKSLFTAACRNKAF